jgi:predicted alpha/beta superfamily hydrolase
MSERTSFSPPSLQPAPATTVVEVRYPAARGRIGLRGSLPPLSWDQTLAPTEVHGDRHVFRLALPPGELLELKVMRDDSAWSGGRSHTVYAGDDLHLLPYFDRAEGFLVDTDVVELGGEQVKFQVFLPPSYEEHPERRYPVVYAQDGQALWTTSLDPYGVWLLDATLNQLYELGAIDEIIVVGVDTSTRRVERLTPVRDAEQGGGEGPLHLRLIVEHLLPRIDAKYRTTGDREDTALLGSSLGGLFSFFAAWTRPDVFGKAACLSSSFWWKDRHAVRMVQSGACPAPRPLLYIDSGAAVNAFENDPNVRDGFHHTQSMFRALVNHCYEPGVNLHRLTFTGQTHDAASWAARVAIPLQLLFPPRAGTSNR